MVNTKILKPKNRKKPTTSLKYDGKHLKTNNNELPEIVRPNLSVKLEKFQVFKHDGQYALCGPTLFKLKELHKELILPIRINSRFVKECPACPYKTIYNHCLKSHQRIVHKTFKTEDLFYCYLCPYSSCEKGKLSIHLISHRTEKSVECPYCGQMFKGKYGLNSHIQWRHTKSIKYRYCDTCAYKSRTNRGLLSHKERAHIPDSDRKEEFSCMLCPFKTNKKWCLKTHIGYKHTERFTCSTCSFSTPLAETLKTHKCKSYECSTCGYTTRRRNNFNVHITKHKKREELPLLKCPFCQYTTTSPSGFHSHKTAHTHNIDVQCPECPLTYKKKSLAAHIKAKHSEKKHECPSCDYTSSNTANLQRHIESKHTDKSDWEVLRCGKCEFETKSKGSLYMHEKYLHSDMQLLKCGKCNFSSVRIVNLRTHEKIHKNRERIACDKCSKTFLSASLLKAHSSRIHEKGKTYACQLCPKDVQRVCSTMADLRSHMLSHKTKTEVQTFKCYECPYESKLKLGLAKHIQVIHRNNKDKYHICSKCYYKTKHKENLKEHIKKMHKKNQEIKKCRRQI